MKKTKIVKPSMLGNPPAPKGRKPSFGGLGGLCPTDDI